MPAAVPGHYMPGFSLMTAAPTDPNNQAAASNQKITTIDGTPSRVAALGALAIAVLVGLRWSGFKFNVTAGN